MNYKILGLAFIISISSVLIIKAGELGEKISYALCSLFVEIPEAWHAIPVYACRKSFIRDTINQLPDSIKRCDKPATILAIKKLKNTPCELYLQYAKWSSQESYRFVLLERDQEKGIFSGFIKKIYYDPEIKKVVRDAKMFDIKGKLNEPVEFHINSVGAWLCKLYKFKQVIPIQKINCTLIVR